MPEALWHFFLKDKQVLMVAGTHGKTTSTAMMAHVMASSGRDPSMLVGGVALDFGSNYRLGAGPHFVIEGDEYDTAFFDKGPKFLHYRAQGAIITAVEFDHADIYRDLEHVKASFRALAAQDIDGRTLIVCADFPNAVEVVGGANARVLTYGLNAGSFRAANLRVGPDGARFAIEREGGTVANEIHLPIGGRMNVANALGVFVLLSEFGVSTDEIARGLKSFKSVARRQQVIGEAAGVTVIDDFAHHPTAIRVTLQAIIERYPNRRILAAFEPRSNTARRNVFQREFGEAFSGASRVYLGPVYFGHRRFRLMTAGRHWWRVGKWRGDFRMRINDQILANADRRPPRRRRRLRIKRPVRLKDHFAAAKSKNRPGGAGVIPGQIATVDRNQ